MATFGYVRVSTDTQDLNNQRHGVIEYAKRHGFEPMSFFEDMASGRKDWRERDLGRLIERLGAGDVVIVNEFSRLGRSTFQVLEIMKLTAEKGAIVHVVKNNMVMDGSLNAKMAAVFFGFAAEVERDFISARTTEALARRKALGLPVGRRPGSKNRDKKLDRAKDRIIEMLNAGVPKAAIARLVDCNPDTLYEWMHENGLAAYIKSGKEKAAASAPVADEAQDSGKDRRRGAARAKAGGRK